MNLKHTSFIALFLVSCLFISCAESYSSTFDISELKEECGSSVNLYNDGEYIIAEPAAGSENALIFYPGGLVSYEAYLPLLIKCAKQGVTCILVQMPSDFAFLNIYAAKRVQMRNSSIKNWYLAGHSLGGAMASVYISSHTNDFTGLILLASFSTKDISQSGLKVLSVYGSNDKVLNTESYKKYFANLPAVPDTKELVIEGGNHGQFASYGEQAGDGEATISAQEQQQITADEIALFITSQS